MRVGLLADSHGNAALLARCATFLTVQHGAERLFFLGGGVADLQAAVEFMAEEGVPGPKISWVAGHEDPGYRPESGREIEMVGDLLATLIHDKAELTRDEITNSTLILHGNSTAPALVQIGPRFFITPGHLRGEEFRGEPPSCGLLALGPKAIQFAIFGADLVERRRETAQLGKRAVFRAG